MPNNVLILHDSALYCDNTDHEQMFFFTRSGVPSADLRIGVPSDDYAKLDNKAAYRRPEKIKNLTGCGQSNN